MSAKRFREADRLTGTQVDEGEEMQTERYTDCLTDAEINKR